MLELALPFQSGLELRPRNLIFVPLYKPVIGCGLSWRLEAVAKHWVRPFLAGKDKSYKGLSCHLPACQAARVREAPDTKRGVNGTPQRPVRLSSETKYELRNLAFGK